MCIRDRDLPQKHKKFEIDNIPLKNGLDQQSYINVLQKKIGPPGRHIQIDRQDLLNSKVDVANRLRDKVKQIRDNILHDR